LERQGYDISILTQEDLFYLFEQLDKSRISKESIPIILERLLSKQGGSIDEIISSFGSEVTEEDIDGIVKKIIMENEKIISQKGMDSIGLLMGRCMSTLRGKVDGEKVNKKLVTRLTEHLNKT
jgi:glutamyl-tRNA(Gln) amidotransferase subunit E